jgi:hypothetical protein
MVVDRPHPLRKQGAVRGSPHERTVHATVFSLLSNKEDAEDVAQDAFVKALGSLNRFRGESAFGTWLIKAKEVKRRRRGVNTPIANTGEQ